MLGDRLDQLPDSRNDEMENEMGVWYCHLFKLKNESVAFVIPITFSTKEVEIKSENEVNYTTESLKGEQEVLVLAHEIKVQGSMDDDSRTQTHQKGEGRGRDLEIIVGRCTAREEATRRRHVEGTRGLEGPTG